MAQKLKAILLAAGLGTRLRPLTLKTPKCLVEINGKPLLAYWLSMLEDIGCDEVIINTHYLKDQVEAFINSWKSESMNIKLSYEKELLGTAGTLIKNIDFFKNSTGLLIHADNLTDEDLSKFLVAHQSKPNYCLLTMLTFKTDNPAQCGIVQKNEQNVVTNFFEKSKGSHGNHANGALYAFDKDFIEYIKNLPSGTTDFSTQIIPELMGRIFSWTTERCYIDIGTHSSLTKAIELWK